MWRTKCVFLPKKYCLGHIFYGCFEVCEACVLYLHIILEKPFGMFFSLQELYITHGAIEIQFLVPHNLHTWCVNLCDLDWNYHYSDQTVQTNPMQM